MLAFAVRIMGVDYPAAMFKLFRRGVCGWSWLYSNGHLIFFDPPSVLNKNARLSDGNIFPNVTEAHFSYPFDGRYHQTIRASGRDTAHLARHRSAAFPDIQCESFRSVDVPLKNRFPPLDVAPWRGVKHPAILRSQDFNGAEDVTLHAYICRKDRVDDLIQRRQRLVRRHWIVGDHDLQLVVLAEPSGMLASEANQSVG
jgi:hypothetical protein